MGEEDRPLAGRVALVTGVSRRQGIGFAVARRLAADGADLAVHGWTPHDAEMPWGVDEGGGAASLATALEASGRRVTHLEVDLAEPAAPRRVVEQVLEAHGRLDIVVANHARSSDNGLADVTAEELDACWAANVRGSLLLVQAWAAHCDPGPTGRVVLFTSGQHLAPMSTEIAYAVSKGALHQLTATLSDALVDLGVTVNCVNPGPTDTGWADDTVHEIVRRRMPRGRWGTPDDVARLVAWLVSDEAGWVTGQVIDSEGGFRR